MEWIKSAAQELSAFCTEEDGITVIEIILILVVVIGLVVLFKSSITELLENIFTEINNQSTEVY